MRRRPFIAIMPFSCKLLSLLPLLALSACVAPPIALSPAAAGVRARRADPPPEYIEIGPIEGAHGSECALFGIFGYTGRYESAYSDLRNKTTSLGGHYVRIDHFSSLGIAPLFCSDFRHKIFGVAYRDPAAPPPAAGATGASPAPAALIPEGTPIEAAVRLDYETLWKAWASAQVSSACAQAETMLNGDADCSRTACVGPLVLSSGYQHACAIDTDERIAIHRLRKRWETEAGESASPCLIEVYRAARDPGLATTLTPRCAGEGKTEAALRDAVRKTAGSAAPAAPKP